jgi:hypothetical protein
MSNSTFQNEATIHNIRLDSHFTITSNATAEDSRLSWAAKGLLWYILSRPKNWKIYLNQLAEVYEGSRERGNGKDAVRSLINELKDVGYVQYIKYKDSKGRWCHRYDVYPVPFQDFQIMFPQQDNPPLVNPPLVNPAIYQERKETNNNLNKKPPPPLTPPKSQSPPLQKNKKKEEEEKIKIYHCLENTILSPDQRKRLSKNYSEEAVIRAVEISRKHKVKKSLMGMLIDILENPGEWEEGEDSATSKALKYNDDLRRVYPNVAKKNDELIPKGTLIILSNEGKEQVSLKSSYFESDMKTAQKILDEIAMKKRNSS